MPSTAPGRSRPGKRRNGIVTGQNGHIAEDFPHMATENLESELAEALKKRLSVIGDRGLRETNPERHLAELRAASERITDLAMRLPATTHPQLRHYFERCSYDKALAWIEQEGLASPIK